MDSLRSKRPDRVTLPESGKALRAAEAWRMVRNLSNTKGCPPWPTLTWRNSTGRPSSSQMMAAHNPARTRTGSATKPTMIRSSTRLPRYPSRWAPPGLTHVVRAASPGMAPLHAGLSVTTRVCRLLCS